MRILVFGAGKSGTTALFYALKKQLPNYEMVFEPPNLSFVDYIHDNLIVKSLNVILWQAEKIHFQKFDRKILLIRHPFDRIISFLLYAPHNGMGFSSDYNASTYINLLREKTKDPSKVNVFEIGNLYTKITGHDFLREFQECHQQILEFYSSTDFCNFELLKYEDFIDGNLKSIEEYVGIQLREPVKVDQRHERVVRKKGHSDWQNWFTKDDIGLFSRRFADFIQRFQYSTSSSSPNTTSIDPLFSYKYTISVINDYRKEHSLPEYKEGTIGIGDEGMEIDAAIQLLSIGSFASARLTINQAIVANPSLSGAYFIKAKSLLSQHRFSEALSILKDEFERSQTSN